MNTAIIRRLVVHSKLLIAALLLNNPGILNAAPDWENRFAAQGWEKISAMPLGETLLLSEKYYFLDNSAIFVEKAALYLDPAGNIAYYTRNVDCPECPVHTGEVLSNGDGKTCLFFPKILGGEKKWCYILWGKEGHVMGLIDNLIYAYEWRITPGKHPIFAR